jgi:hypothetical protein
MKTYLFTLMQRRNLTGKYVALLSFCHCIAHSFVSGTDAIVETGCGERSTALSNISIIPDMLVPEPGDHVVQSELLQHIIGTTLSDPANIDDFNNRKVYKIRLSTLKEFYDEKDGRVLSYLPGRHTIHIDSKYRLELGTGQISMDTSTTMLDFQLTVAKQMGFGPLLPNAANAHMFSFDMDLKRATHQFHGKHSMIGFDTKGSILYIGQAMNVDVYLAMAPNAFLNGSAPACHAGYSTGPSTMTTRHYRQIVMMISHFLEKVADRAYYTLGDPYGIDLDSASPNWGWFTSIM